MGSRTEDSSRDLVMSNSITATLSANKLLESGHNWISYKGRFLLAVRQSRLSNRLSDDAKPKPKMYSKTAGPNSVYVEDLAVNPPVPVAENLIEERIKEIDIWESQEATVIHFMVCSVPNRLVNRLLALPTAKACWDLLSTQFESKSELAKQDLRRQLNHLSCPEGADIRAHIDTMVEIHSNLTAMGEIIDDQTFRSTIAISLPHSLDHWQSVLDISMRSLGKVQTSQTFIDQIRQQLDHQDIMVNSRAARDIRTTDNPELMFTRSDSRTNGGNARRSDVKCFYCEKRGHYVQDCRKKIRDLAGNNSNGNDATHLNNSNNSGNDQRSNGRGGDTGNQANFADTNSSDAPMAWMIEEISQPHALADDIPATPPIPIPATYFSCTIDSGATCHYCPNRDQFIDFEESVEMKSRTADGHVSNSKGRGKVAISLPNGNLPPTRVILEDVFYSPHLESTLISASRIDQKGCRMEFGGGKVGIFAPNGERMALVSQQNGHYRFYSPRSDTGYVAGDDDDEEDDENFVDPIVPLNAAAEQDSADVDPSADHPVYPLPVDPPLIAPEIAARQSHHRPEHVVAEPNIACAQPHKLASSIANGPDTSNTAPGGDIGTQDPVSDKSDTPSSNLPDSFPADHSFPTASTHFSQLCAESTASAPPLPSLHIGHPPVAQRYRRQPRPLTPPPSPNLASNPSLDDIPKSLEEAITGTDRENWITAMDEEVTVLKDMGAYDLAGPLKPRWLFGIKRNENDDILRYKARLVLPT
jgi:hypothetical protein